MTGINMHIVARELSDKAQQPLVHALCSPDDAAPLRYCSLWQDAGQARPDTVYVLDEHQTAGLLLSACSEDPPPRHLQNRPSRPRTAPRTQPSHSRSSASGRLLRTRWPNSVIM